MQGKVARVNLFSMALFPKLPMKLCGFISAISTYNHHQNPNKAINVALFFRSCPAVSESKCPIVFEDAVDEHIQKENKDDVRNKRWNQM
jgi:hypothetical protein